MHRLGRSVFDHHATSLFNAASAGLADACALALIHAGVKCLVFLRCACTGAVTLRKQVESLCNRSTATPASCLQCELGRPASCIKRHSLKLRAICGMGEGSVHGVNRHLYTFARRTLPLQGDTGNFEESATT